MRSRSVLPLAAASLVAALTLVWVALVHWDKPGEVQPELGEPVRLELNVSQAGKGVQKNKSRDQSSVIPTPAPSVKPDSYPSPRQPRSVATASQPKTSPRPGAQSVPRRAPARAGDDDDGDDRDEKEIVDRDDDRDDND